MLSNLSVTPPEFANPNPTFDGMTGGGSPQDTNGAPGPSHYVQAINESFAVFRKTDGALLAGPTAITSLWAIPSVPVNDDCRARMRSDPYVIYDHLADRWVITEIANKGTDVGDPLQIQCIAVSRGPNPVTDGWYVYTFDLGVSNDYPKLAVWPDGYYLITQQGYNGNNLDATVFDRANMLNGNPATFQRRSFLPGGATVITLPSELSGQPPDPGTPNIYVRPVDGGIFGGADRVEIFEFHTDWGVPVNTTFSMVQTLFPSAFSSDICAGGNLFNNCIPQPGTATMLEALSVWPMAPANYRNFGDHESIVFNHTVDVGGDVAGIRWYELQRSGGGPWSIHQEGTFSPPDGQEVHRWMGSVSIDAAGDMALGYSVSNDGVAPHNPVFPGVRYVGRLATDPLGLMPFGEVEMATGGSSQGGTRWGDYSAMRVDPVDGCTFWYTTQYLHANAPTRRTRIAAFRFPTCNPADLAITKLDSPDPVVAGNQLNYTINVTNNGPADATGVVVTDTLPAGVVFLSSSIPCSGGAVKTCNIGTLASGASSGFTIQVRVPSSAVPGSITNTATVDANELDPDADNNTATATTQVITEADLVLFKECKPDQPNTQPAGTSTFCDIYVDNPGPSDAVNVVITDHIISNTPITITGVSSSSTSGPAAVCAPVPPIGPTTTTTITCTDLVLPADARDVIRVTFTANNGGDVDDTASVTSTTSDSNPDNNSAVGRVSFRSSVDLSLIKGDAPDPVTAGTNLTYTLNVANAGPSTAANVVVHDALSGQVSFVSATPSQGTCQAGVVPGDPSKPLTCNLGAIPSGGGATLTVVVKVNSDVPAGTILVNNADVTSDGGDSNTGNNLATATTTVRTNADLAITKTSDASVYKPSSVVTYAINVTNNGPSKSLNVVVTDNLPDLKQAIYQSDTGGCVQSTPTTLTCNMGDMTVGQSKTFFIYVLVKGNRGVIANTASVSSASSPPTPDSTPGNNSVTRLVTIGH